MKNIGQTDNWFIFNLNIKKTTTAAKTLHTLALSAHVLKCFFILFMLVCTFWNSSYIILACTNIPDDSHLYNKSADLSFLAPDFEGHIYTNAHISFLKQTQKRINSAKVKLEQSECLKKARVTQPTSGR